MVSLYVCDFPQDLDKEDIESIFSSFNGFKELRIAKDKTG